MRVAYLSSTSKWCIVLRDIDLSMSFDSFSICRLHWFIIHHDASSNSHCWNYFGFDHPAIRDFSGPIPCGASYVKFHSSWHSFGWTYAELFPSGKLFWTSNALKERTSLPQFFPGNGGRHLHLVKSLSWYNAMQLPPFKQGCCRANRSVFAISNSSAVKRRNLLDTKLRKPIQMLRYVAYVRGISSRMGSLLRGVPDADWSCHDRGFFGCPLCWIFDMSHRSRLLFQIDHLVTFNSHCVLSRMIIN